MVQSISFARPTGQPVAGPSSNKVKQELSVVETLQYMIQRTGAACADFLKTADATWNAFYAENHHVVPIVGAGVAMGLVYKSSDYWMPVVSGAGSAVTTTTNFVSETYQFCVTAYHAIRFSTDMVGPVYKMVSVPFAAAGSVIATSYNTAQQVYNLVTFNSVSNPLPSYEESVGVGFAAWVAWLGYRIYGPSLCNTRIWAETHSLAKMIPGVDKVPLLRTLLSWTAPAAKAAGAPPAAAPAAPIVPPIQIFNIVPPRNAQWGSDRVQVD